MSSGRGGGKLNVVTPTPSTVTETPPTVFVLFGASGDLAARLVLPAFYRLAQEKLLPPAWLLVGSGPPPPVRRRVL